MINPKIIYNEKPLYVLGNKIIFSVGNYLFEKVENTKDKKIIGYYRSNFFLKISLVNSILHQVC